MERSKAISVAACAAIVTFELGYLYSSFGSIRLWWYYPLEHRWAFELKPIELAMNWYGRNLVATLWSAAGFLTAYAVARRREHLPPGGQRLLAACIAASVLIGVALFACQISGSQPTPQPLPAWYVPR